MFLSLIFPVGSSQLPEGNAQEVVESYVYTPIEGDATMSGYTAPNEYLELFVNGQPYDTYANEAGQFVFDNLPVLALEDNVKLIYEQQSLDLSVLPVGSGDKANNFSVTDDTDPAETEETVIEEESFVGETTVDSTEGESEEVNETSQTEELDSSDESTQSSSAAVENPGDETDGIPTTQAVQSGVVTTATQFINALNDPTLQTVTLGANIQITGGSGAIPVRSNSGNKVIEGNGYALIINSNRSITNGAINPVSSLRVNNVSNMLIRGTNSVFFNINADLYLQNVTYNRDSVADTGSLGTGRRVFFSGTNTLNTYSRNTLNYGTVTVNSGSALTVHHGGNEPAFIANNFSVQSGAVVNLHGDFLAGTGGPALINSLSSPLTVNVSGTLNMYGSQAFSNVGQAVTVTVNAGSVLNIEAKTNPFSWLTGPGTVNVANNATLSIRRTGTGTDPLFSNLSPLVFNITNPNLVNMQTPSGSILFEPSGSFTFNVNNVRMQSWLQNPNNNSPDSDQYAVTSGRFSIAGGRTTVSNMNPPVDNFSVKFPPTMSRLQFAQPHVAPKPSAPVVNQPIYDTTRTITGRAPAGSTVELMDRQGNVIATTTADASGNFVFELSTPFAGGTTIGLRTRRENSTSTVVSVIVQGNRLEFHTVPSDMTFEYTEIRNDPNHIIYRTAPVDYLIEIMDTRKDNSWRLTAEVITPLTNAENHTLTNALYFKEGNNLRTMENGQIEVATSDDIATNPDITPIRWGLTNGIVIQTNPINAMPTSDYSAEIEWVLVDAP